MTPPGNISTQTEGMTTEVYALLAQANLLRIRGSWWEAVDKCMEAMRLVPGNGAAQSLLGDIYENQGKLDDAIRWYRMALDTNPNSPADKQKLARLVSIRGQNMEDAAAIVPPPVTASSVPIPSSTLVKSNAVRMTALLCGIALIGIVLTAVVQSHGPADARSKTGQSSNRTVNVDPNAILPTQIDNGAMVLAARDPFEVSLYESLRNAGGLTPDVRFADIIADPRNGRLTLTYVVRPLRAISRESVLRSALLAAESAASLPATSSYPYLTLRMLLSSDDLITSPDTGSWIFIGDIGRADLVDFPTDLTAVPVSQISSAFTDQWWAPSLTPAAVPVPLPSTISPLTTPSEPISSQPLAPLTSTPQLSTQAAPSDKATVQNLP